MPLLLRSFSRNIPTWKKEGKSQYQSIVLAVNWVSWYLSSPFSGAWLAQSSVGVNKQKLSFYQLYCTGRNYSTLVFDFPSFSHSNISTAGLKLSEYLSVGSWLQPGVHCPIIQEEYADFLAIQIMNIFLFLAALLGPWHKKFALSSWVVLDHWVTAAAYFLVRLCKASYEFWIIIGIISEKGWGLLLVAFQV